MKVIRDVVENVGGVERRKTMTRNDLEQIYHLDRELHILESEHKGVGKCGGEGD